MLADTYDDQGGDAGSVHEEPSSGGGGSSEEPSSSSDGGGGYQESSSTSGDSGGGYQVQRMEAKTGMSTASEIAAELIRQGVDPSVANQESGYLASTYGAIPAGAVQDYLKRSTNLVDNWDRPTASAGGVGGDIDLDGDGVVDRGWNLVDSPDTGNPGWVQTADVGKLSGNVVFNVGGQQASDVVKAYLQAEGLYNSAQETARQEIDRLNTTGVFDDSSGQSEAGIAAARANIGKSLFNAQGRKLGSLLGYAEGSSRNLPQIMPDAGAGAPVSGKRTTLLPAGPLRTASGGTTPASTSSSSTLLPAGPLRSPTAATTTTAAAGASVHASSPIVPIGLAVAALKFFRMF